MPGDLDSLEQELASKINQDRTVELLLRSFLSSEKAHRTQQAEEHRAINHSLSNIGKEITDANTKLIGLDIKMSQQNRDLIALEKRVEKVEGGVDEVSEETGLGLG